MENGYFKEMQRLHKEVTKHNPNAKLFTTRELYEEYFHYGFTEDDCIFLPKEYFPDGTDAVLCDEDVLLPKGVIYYDDIN